MTEERESPVIEYARRARERLLRGERQRAVRLVNVYGASYQRLQAYIEALEARMLAEAEKTGKPMSQRRVRDLAAYKRLLSQIEEEIARYAQYAGEEMGQGARDAIASGMRDALKEVQLSLPAADPGRIEQIWRGLPNEAIETLLGMTETGSPLRGAFESELGPAVARKAADRILLSVALGKNPRVIARELTKDLGAGLVWSLRTVRTAQLWSYRTSKTQSWRENPELYRGWVWHADLKVGRTCPACIAMHGTRHGPEEELNDHYNGRCAPVPITPTYQELLGLDEPIEGDIPPALEIGQGQEWFKKLTDAEQEQILGGARFRAYKAGALKMREGPQGIVQTTKDPVYGPMRSEQSLKGALGAEDAREFYSGH